VQQETLLNNVGLSPETENALAYGLTVPTFASTVKWQGWSLYYTR